MKTAETYAVHCTRVESYLQDPLSLPFYEQKWVDTTSQKASRAATMALEAATYLGPFLSKGGSAAIVAANATWKYGQYGLLCFALQGELSEALQVLMGMGSVMKELQPKEALIGMMYLAAEQRQALRDTPGAAHEEADAQGEDLPEELLDCLIGLAMLSTHAPYSDDPFEVQRLALLQNWRLVTERLTTSWKHQPAWCLYIHRSPENRIATIAIRGTDLEKSIGGDLFTDVNAYPETTVADDGAEMTAHTGMLASARTLEAELRHLLLLLAGKGFQIYITGHSLGAGVSAVLCWLLRHGKERGKLASARIVGVGYATPCAVDSRTADSMKPYFTSVVNSMDVVPRLSVGTLSRLSREMKKCAENSAADLDSDVRDYLNRASTLWAPNVRQGKVPVHQAQAPSSAAGAALPDPAEVTATAAGERQTVEQADLGDRTTSADSTACNRDTVETRTIKEGAALHFPGGVESIVRAWFGNADLAWEEGDGIGKDCTREVKECAAARGRVNATVKELGDPGLDPGLPYSTLSRSTARRVLLVDVRFGSDLFCAGNVVWIHRHHGCLRASIVSCSLSSLRRIIFDKRLVTDHYALSYYQALLAVRQRVRSGKSVPWKRFSDASMTCPCCHSEYNWNSTGRGAKTRCLSMTNCRSCGVVVCVGCASTRHALPEQGILEPARVCDACTWHCPDGAKALPALADVLARTCPG